MKVYSGPEVAKILGVSGVTVANLVKRGKLRDLRARVRHKHWLKIPKQSVDAYLSSGNGGTKALHNRKRMLHKVEQIMNGHSEKTPKHYLTSLNSRMDALELQVTQRLSRIESKLDSLSEMWK